MTTGSGSHSGSGRATRSMVALLAAVLGATTGIIVVPAHAQTPGPTTSVILRATAGHAAEAEAAVLRAGGTVTRRIGIIDAVVADVPVAAVAALAATPDIVSVTPNARAHLLSTTSWSATSDVGSMYNTTLITGAQNYWKAGWTGKGVDIALIDSGVVSVNGLQTTGKVITGPDLSFESQTTNLQHIDTFGHGTHMAGIILGRDTNAISGRYAGDSTDFLGMAPDARLISVKVADSHGATDVSQMLAAIDWVVQHRTDNGMNIRVINLSYGTDSAQVYSLDPLAYAAEVAWRSGIVVVASVGNLGANATNGVNDPADDPYVLAVGAADTQASNSTSNDTVASFSSIGKGRNPDLVAPGVHIVSLRDVGSYIDLNYSSTGAVTSRFFRGSGTSQAAAVMSGAVALVVQQHPTATPDQVKQLLMSTATPLPSPATASGEGKGEVNLAKALSTAVPTSTQSWTKSTGTGTLEGSRGSQHLVSNGVSLSGEKDIFGIGFSSSTMASAEATKSSWSGGTWNGQSWSGSTWSGSTWSGQSWSGSDWAGQSWSSIVWSSNTWNGSTWSGSTWSTNYWQGSTWSTTQWPFSSWS